MCKTKRERSKGEQHVLLAELVVKNFNRCEVDVLKGRGRADMLIEKLPAGGFQKQSVGSMDVEGSG
jgi:hypothetical protein